MNFKYKYVELAFRDEETLERELRKLDFLKKEEFYFEPRKYKSTLVTDAPFRVKVEVPSEMFLIQNIDDSITILMDASEEKVKEFKKFNQFRAISILLPKASKEDIKKLIDYCKKEELYYLYRYSKRLALEYIYNIDDILEEGKTIPFFYFWIRGNTNKFNTLNEYMDNRLLLTEYADFGNIVDKDSCFIEEFTSFINNTIQLKNKEEKLNRNLEYLVEQIEDVEALKYLLNNYSYILTLKQRKIVQDRIDLLSGETFHFKEDMIESFKSLECDVLKLRKLTKMNRKEFAAYFGIPYRTVEDWENKKSTCSSYLFELMKFKIEKDFF